jgi:predicted kinase
VLVIMTGLPATGKTTVGRALAREISAVHLRIDTIEQAVVRAGAGRHPLGAVGYVIGYALAEDYLRQGLTVVADSVNPLAITRRGWHAVAAAVGIEYLDVEVVCSDPVEHQRRATTRMSDIPGLDLPTWREIEEREYEPWDGDRVVLDTARNCVTECVARLRALVSRGKPIGSDDGAIAASE